MQRNDTHPEITNEEAQQFYRDVRTYGLEIAADYPDIESASPSELLWAFRSTMDGTEQGLSVWSRLVQSLQADLGLTSEQVVDRHIAIERKVPTAEKCKETRYLRTLTENTKPAEVYEDDGAVIALADVQHIEKYKSSENPEELRGVHVITCYTKWSSTDDCWENALYIPAPQAEKFIERWTAFKLYHTPSRETKHE